MNKKLNVLEQVRNAFEIRFEYGKAKGKSCILVHSDNLEILFSKDNALDIQYVKFNGKNVSLLTKNGINCNEGSFPKRFEGGFLYTCGLENIGTAVETEPLHGSLHHNKAENVNITVTDEKVVIEGVVKNTELFGKNLYLERRFEIYDNKIFIKDTVVNKGFTKTGFALLYHNNYGYPFLDENLQIKMNLLKSEGRNELSQNNIKNQYKITAPIDGGEEECFYNYSKDGIIELINKELKTGVKIKYDTKEFPLFIEWKSMVSGDYALGIEPATSRFDDFKLVYLAPDKKKTYNLEIDFNTL